MTIKEKIKNLNWKVLYADRILLLNLIVGLFFNLACWVILSFQFKPQDEPVILHYNIYFGIDLIGPWYKIYGLPVFGLVTLFINNILSVIIYQKEKFLSYLLIHGSTLIQIVLAVTSFFISLQNL